MAEHSPHPSSSTSKAGTGVSRRDFIRTAAATGASVMIVPRHVLGQGMTPPSDLLNIATVGINGMGASNTQAVMSENIVAICDCDFGLLDKKLASWHETVYPSAPPESRQAGRRNVGPRPDAAWTDFGPSAAQREADARWTERPLAARLKRFVDQQMPRVQRYRDYREMLDKQKDLDAVIVATPDHMHAVIASAAMDAGKHVYVQKPLCWSVQEARHLARRAAETKVVTQMGNQGHSDDEARRGQEYLAARAIGDIREIHVWTNRPLGYWPQGVPRPGPLTGDTSDLGWNNAGVMKRLAAAMYGDYPVPTGLSWDLFLGGAPRVDYHPIYHPFNWRGWVDWGQGALGDMGAHLIDHPVWGLDLGLPTVVETVSTPFNGVSYPHATTTYYEFAGRARHAAGHAHLVRRRAAARASGRTRRGGAERRRRCALHRQQGQAAAEHLRPPAAAAPGRAPQCVWPAEGAAAPHPPPVARDELGERDQGHGPDLLSVLGTPRNSSRSCCSASSRCGRGGGFTTTAPPCGSPTTRRPTTS